jgi:hypothetical protein
VDITVGDSTPKEQIKAVEKHLFEWFIVDGSTCLWSELPSRCGLQYRLPGFDYRVATVVTLKNRFSSGLSYYQSLVFDW